MATYYIAVPNICTVFTTDDDGVGGSSDSSEDSLAAEESEYDLDDSFAEIAGLTTASKQNGPTNRDSCSKVELDGKNKRRRTFWASKGANAPLLPAIHVIIYKL